MAKKSARQAASKRLKVTLVRSPIGFNKKQRVVLRGLGLRRMHQTVEVEDTPCTRGMINKVSYMVRVEEA